MGRLHTCGELGLKDLGIQRLLQCCHIAGCNRHEWGDEDSGQVVSNGRCPRVTWASCAITPRRVATLPQVASTERMHAPHTCMRVLECRIWNCLAVPLPVNHMCIHSSVTVQCERTRLMPDLYTQHEVQLSLATGRHPVQLCLSLAQPGLTQVDHPCPAQQCGPALLSRGSFGDWTCCFPSLQ